MIASIRKAALPLAAVATLAGCSFGTSSVPNAGPGAPAATQAQTLAAPNVTSVVYSTHLAFRGADGQRYSGDAVVFPEKLLPGLHLSAAMKAAIASFASPHGGSLTYYLNIPGVTGTVGAGSPSNHYTGWNQITNFSIGYGPDKGNKKQVTTLVFGRQVDVVTPFILGHLFSGSPFCDKAQICAGTGTQNPTGTELDVVRPNQQLSKNGRVMYFTFTGVYALSYATTYTGQSPSEVNAFLFRKATFCVIPTSPSGKQGSPVCSTWTPS